MNRQIISENKLGLILFLCILGGIAGTKLFDKVFKTENINSLTSSSNNGNPLVSNDLNNIPPAKKSMPKFSNIRSLLMGRRIREVKEMLGSPNEEWNGSFGSTLIYYEKVEDDFTQDLRHIAISLTQISEVTDVRSYKGGTPVEVGYHQWVKLPSLTGEKKDVPLPSTRGNISRHIYSYKEQGFSTRNGPDKSMNYEPDGPNDKGLCIVSINYELPPGANRPSATILYNDSFEFSLIAVCPGEFAWCIRDDNNNDIGALKFSFAKSNEHLKIDMISDNPPIKYKKYLDIVEGYYSTINPY